MDGTFAGVTGKVEARASARLICGKLQRTGKVAEFLPQVVNIMASADIVIKKMCYNTYSRHAHRAPTEALLAVNTILKDSKNASPSVRALVLRSLTHLNDDLTGGIKSKVLHDGLKDMSSFVRRHAVLCQSHDQFMSSDGAVNIHPLVFDPDPLVAAYALECSTSVVKDQATVYRLLNNITSYTEEGICKVLEILREFTSADQQELLNIMSIIDSFLDSDSLPVATATMDVFCTFSAQMDELIKKDIQVRLRDCCLRFLRSADITSQYGILVWLIHQNGLIEISLFASEYHVFLCKTSDPDFVKALKIDNVYLLADGENIDILLSNFQTVAEGGNEKLFSVINKALQHLMTSFPDQTTQSLKDICSSTNFNTLIGVLPSVLLFHDSLSLACEPMLITLLSRWKELTDRQLEYLLCLATEYAHQHTDSRQYISEIASNVHKYKTSSHALQIATMQCVFGCFKAQPAEYRSIFEACLKHFKISSDPVLLQLATWTIDELKSLV